VPGGHSNAGFVDFNPVAFREGFGDLENADYENDIATVAAKLARVSASSSADAS
jgi:hypothetical protein